MQLCVGKTFIVVCDKMWPLPFTVKSLLFYACYRLYDFNKQKTDYYISFVLPFFFHFVPSTFWGGF